MINLLIFHKISKYSTSGQKLQFFKRKYFFNFQCILLTKFYFWKLILRKQNSNCPSDVILQKKSCYFYDLLIFEKVKYSS